MGFYGNITNTSKTNFVFDKIYTNRKAMDDAQRKIDPNTGQIIGDGVFIGRYVLVEYGQITNDSFIRAYLINNKFYTTNVEDINTEILYTADKNKVEDRYITNGIVIYTINFCLCQCTFAIYTIISHFLAKLHIGAKKRNGRSRSLYTL